MASTIETGKIPSHHHLGMNTLNSETKRPSFPPVIAFELNKFCHITASVHCGMIYGKIKIALRYFLNLRFVRVTR